MSLSRAQFLVGVLALGIASATHAVSAQTDPELRQPASKDWLHAGGDWSNSRYSTLTEITPTNVKTLKGAWVTHLEEEELSAVPDWAGFTIDR